MKNTLNKIYNLDCICGMKEFENNKIDFTITDIPYNAVSRSSNGLRNLNKKEADILTFDLNVFFKNNQP